MAANQDQEITGVPEWLKQALKDGSAILRLIPGYAEAAPIETPEQVREPSDTVSREPSE